jgi:hypothetical protein
MITDYEHSKTAIVAPRWKSFRNAKSKERIRKYRGI